MRITYSIVGEARSSGHLEIMGLDNEINNLLIVGASDTSLSFSNNLQEMTAFTRVIHVIHAKDAVHLLVEQTFPVIVVDCDAKDVDASSLTNLIREYLPLCRIVVIGQQFDLKAIKLLINEGSVDFFLPIPIDDFTASSVIIEQYAKYQINQTLFQLVTVEPPKFSPSYFLLHDPSLSTTSEEVELFGFVISYSSLTRFAKFYSDFFHLDEYLITGYISAITMLGEQLFREGETFQEINFGGISVILHQDDQVQFLFFFKHLNKENYIAIEPKIQSIIDHITSKHSIQLKSEYPLSDEIDEDIENQIEELQAEHQKIVSIQRKQNLVIYGNQLPKLNTILHAKSNKFNISRFMEKETVLSYLLDGKVDVLIINQILDKDKWNFKLAGVAKDISPAVQIIALLKEMNETNLLRILNNEYLDYVLWYKDSPLEIEKYLDKASVRALRIKNGTMHQLHNSTLSFHQSKITRSMLRSKQSSFQVSSVPELHGIFIIREDLPFYSLLWPISERDINFDQQLFANFVSSLEMFTDEIFTSQVDFSGLKFGDIHLVIKQVFDFSFVYFVSNLDHTNFQILDKQLKRNSQILFEQILNSDIYQEQLITNSSLQKQIKHLITNLHIRLLSLNIE